MLLLLQARDMYLAEDREIDGVFADSQEEENEKSNVYIPYFN